MNCKGWRGKAETQQHSRAIKLSRSRAHNGAGGSPNPIAHAEETLPVGGDPAAADGTPDWHRYRPGLQSFCRATCPASVSASLGRVPVVVHGDAASATPVALVRLRRGPGWKGRRPCAASAHEEALEATLDDLGVFALGDGNQTFDDHFAQMRLFMNDPFQLVGDR